MASHLFTTYLNEIELYNFALCTFRCKIRYEIIHNQSGCNLSVTSMVRYRSKGVDESTACGEIMLIVLYMLYMELGNQYTHLDRQRSVVKWRPHRSQHKSYDRCVYTSYANYYSDNDDRVSMFIVQCFMFVHVYATMRYCVICMQLH